MPFFNKSASGHEIIIQKHFEYFYRLFIILTPDTIKYSDLCSDTCFYSCNFTLQNKLGVEI